MFFSPIGSVDPIHSIMNAFYVQLVEDSLTEFVYPTRLGGLHYQLTAVHNGIRVD
jgi:secreted Zn-dependent insulinase-like peptidase